MLNVHDGRNNLLQETFGDLEDILNQPVPKLRLNMLLKNLVPIFSKVLGSDAGLPRIEALYSKSVLKIRTIEAMRRSNSNPTISDKNNQAAVSPVKNFNDKKSKEQLSGSAPMQFNRSWLQKDKELCDSFVQQVKSIMGNVFENSCTQLMIQYPLLESALNQIIELNKKESAANLNDFKASLSQPQQQSNRGNQSNRRRSSMLRQQTLSHDRSAVKVHIDLQSYKQQSAKVEEMSLCYSQVKQENQTLRQRLKLLHDQYDKELGVRKQQQFVRADRDMQTLQNLRQKRSKEIVKNGISDRQLEPLDEFESKIVPVEFFDSLSEIGPAMQQKMNNKIADVRNSFQDILEQNLQELDRLKVRIKQLNDLSPDAYSVANLSVLDIFRGCAKKETDPARIWIALKKAYSEDYFINVVEEQYGQRFVANYNALYLEVNKVQQQAYIEIEKLEKSSKEELNAQKYIVQELKAEVALYRENFREQLHKIQENCRISLEKDFVQRESQSFQKQLRREKQLQIEIDEKEDLCKNAKKIIARVRQRMFFDRLKIITIAVKQSRINEDDSKILGFLRGDQTTETLDLYQKMKSRIYELESMTTELQDKCRKLDYKNTMLEDQIKGLDAKIHEIGDQISSAQNKQMIAYEESRKACFDILSYQEKNKILESIIESLQDENQRLTNQLKRLTKSKLRSNVLEAELYRKTAQNNIVHKANVALSKNFSGVQAHRSSQTYVVGLKGHVVHLSDKEYQRKFCATYQESSAQTDKQEELRDFKLGKKKTNKQTVIAMATQNFSSKMDEVMNNLSGGRQKGSDKNQSPTSIKSGRQLSKRDSSRLNKNASTSNKNSRINTGRIILPYVDGVNTNSNTELPIAAVQEEDQEKKEEDTDESGERPRFFGGKVRKLLDLVSLKKVKSQDILDTDQDEKSVQQDHFSPRMALKKIKRSSKFKKFKDKMSKDEWWKEIGERVNKLEALKTLNESKIKYEVDKSFEMIKYLQNNSTTSNISFQSRDPACNLAYSSLVQMCKQRIENLTPCMIINKLERERNLLQKLLSVDVQASRKSANTDAKILNFICLDNLNIQILKIFNEAMQKNHGSLTSAAANLGVSTSPYATVVAPTVYGQDVANAIPSLTSQSTALLRGATVEETPKQMQLFTKTAGELKSSSSFEQTGQNQLENKNLQQQNLYIQPPIQVQESISNFKGGVIVQSNKKPSHIVASSQQLIKVSNGSSASQKVTPPNSRSLDNQSTLLNTINGARPQYNHHSTTNIEIQKHQLLAPQPELEDSQIFSNNEIIVQKLTSPQTNTTTEEGHQQPLESQHQLYNLDQASDTIIDDHYQAGDGESQQKISTLQSQKMILVGRSNLNGRATTANIHNKRRRATFASRNFSQQHKKNCYNTQQQLPQQLQRYAEAAAHQQPILRNLSLVQLESGQCDNFSKIVKSSKNQALFDKMISQAVTAETRNHYSRTKSANTTRENLTGSKSFSSIAQINKNKNNKRQFLHLNNTNSSSIPNYNDKKSTKLTNIINYQFINTTKSGSLGFQHKRNSNTLQKVKASASSTTLEETNAYKNHINSASVLIAVIPDNNPGDQLDAATPLTMQMSGRSRNIANSHRQKNQNQNGQHYSTHAAASRSQPYGGGIQVSDVKRKRVTLSKLKLLHNESSSTLLRQSTLSTDQHLNSNNNTTKAAKGFNQPRRLGQQPV